MKKVKAKVVPLKFKEINEREEKEFRVQLLKLNEMYGAVAELMDPVVVGEEIPACDAVIFPQLIGAAYEYKEILINYNKPIVVITSQFGTVDMWDWELISYMKNLGLNVFSPYNEHLANTIFRAMAVKEHLKVSKFLMFQDNPGEGMQANIFKRFYWWNEECTKQIESTFGTKILYRSWNDVNKIADEINNDTAEKEFESWGVKCEDISNESKLLAAKLYLAVCKVIDEFDGVDGIGANCLNESMFSMTTPCLVWNMLFEKYGIIWCCEGDTLTLLSTYILYQSLETPVMMTNIYPFLVGKAAVHHEKIDDFPQIDEPENHALGVHCGYAGFAPRSFCTSWKMVPRVLEIVNEKAYMINCELALGDMVLAKINSSFDEIMVIPGKIEKYLQFPGTDARNASLLKYKRGERVMEELNSHHQMIIVGREVSAITQISKVFGWKMEVID